MALRGLRNRRLAGGVLVLGIAFGLATACTGTSPMTADSAGAPQELEARGSAGDAGGSGDSGGSGGKARSEKPVEATNQEIRQPGVDRKLVRTATIELAADDVGEVVDRARDIATTEGGYAGREEVREETASLTLHIPSDRFDQALGDLSELGEVTSRDQTAEDVTEQVVDLDSRVATQRASVDRVRALLARAGTVDEIVRIEQELTTREAELESLTQRQQALAGQVAMSTVTLEVAESSTAPAPKQDEEESSGFLAGLTDGWNAFLGAGAVTLRVVGAVLPFLLVLAIPGVPALRWWRRRRTTAPTVPTAPAVQQP